MLVRPGEPLTILVVDDQESVRAALAGELDHAGHRVIEANGAAWALELYERHRPDLVLLDVEMPDHDGYWVAAEIRARDPANWTPIIFLSVRQSEADFWRGIEAGGDDYLVKPVAPVVLHAKLHAMARLRRMRAKLLAVSDELRAANERLEALSTTDALTGLLNRRAFDTRLADEMAAARREHSVLTLVLIDVDHFKRYNDEYGHPEGDRCLQQVASMLRQCCRRPRDVAARYGGEEFALILPGTPRSGALTFARAITRLLAAQALPHPGSPVAPYVTVSGGITSCVPDETVSSDAMLLRADEALYTAKTQGRNGFFSFELQINTARSGSDAA